VGSPRPELGREEIQNMFIIHENEREYRFGNSGPKYLMKGPRMNFAIVQFQPGEDFKAHFHNTMEENFFILEGEVDIVVDGTVHHLVPGQLIHIEPEEIHYVMNNGTVPVKMISTLAPFEEVDKVEVDSYTYKAEA
jgi:quercetin dioxygenase-like cupin family protein